jgi:hypothetical protein
MAVLYWILCFFIGLLPAYFVFRKDRKRTFPLKWLPALLRFCTFFFTAALLLAPAFPSKNNIEEKPVVLWLQDESSSIKDALKKDSTTFRNTSEKIWKAQNKQFNVIPLGFGNTLINKSFFKYAQTGTDISLAIQEGLRRYQSRNVTAIVLVSDGNYNMGSNPIYSLTNNPLPIYTIGLGDSSRPKDLSISYARANKTALLGNSFELSTNIQAEKLAGQSGAIKIIHHQKIIQQQNFTIHNNFYNNSFRFYLPTDQKGLQQYSISVTPLSGEQNIENNQKDIFINVLEKNISIFIAASAPHPDIAAIKEALSHNPEYKIRIEYGKSVPASISGQDLLITHDLPDHQGVKIPAHGNMPMWNIIGPHTDLNAFSKEQPLLKIQSGNGFDNALPAFNPTFSLFALPEDIRAVTAQMPPLKAPSGKYQNTGGEILFRQQINQEGNHPPLWIIKNGKDPQSVLCGTGIWRWRLYSFKNFKQSETVDNLIRQTISLLTYQNNSHPFKITLPKYKFQDKEPILFHASLQDATGVLTNAPTATLIIKDSAGKERSFTFDKFGKSYALSAGILPSGNYTFSGKVFFNGKTLRDEGDFKVAATPLEQLKSYSDFALLYKLSQNTGGHFFTMSNMEELVKALDKNPDMKPVIRQETHYYHWIDLKWLFFFILIFATSEWVLRKYWGI